MGKVVIKILQGSAVTKPC